MRVLRGRAADREADREATRDLMEFVREHGSPRSASGRRAGSSPSGGGTRTRTATTTRERPPASTASRRRSAASAGGPSRTRRRRWRSRASSQSRTSGQGWASATTRWSRTSSTPSTPLASTRGRTTGLVLPGRPLRLRRRKLAGVAQRVTKGAALTSGVLVVDDHEEIARVLADVYPALGVAFDPESVGSVAASGGDTERVRDELEDALVGDADPDVRWVRSTPGALPRESAYESYPERHARGRPDAGRARRRPRTHRRRRREPDGETFVDAAGNLLLPGMIDVHVHFRQPGYGHKETWGRGRVARRRAASPPSSTSRTLTRRR